MTPHISVDNSGTVGGCGGAADCAAAGATSVNGVSVDFVVDEDDDEDDDDVDDDFDGCVTMGFAETIVGYLSLMSSRMSTKTSASRSLKRTMYVKLGLLNDERNTTTLRSASDLTMSLCTLLVAVAVNAIMGMPAPRRSRTTLSCWY